MDSSRKLLSSGALRFVGSPWILLSLTMLAWGGNVVAARLARGEISPMMLVCLRWAVVLVVLVAYAPRQIFVELRNLRPHWVFVLLMGGLGFTLSNGLLFLGAQTTSGINVAIIQGTMPMFVLIGAKLVYGFKIGLVRGLCVLLTFLGILLVISQGDLTTLGSLRFNWGDVSVVGGCLAYAIFTLALRQRPNVSAFGFFIGLAFAAFLTSLPPMALEIAFGAAIWPGVKGLFILLYVAIFTSLLGQIFFIRAVTIVGPGRAGMFQNAVPVVGALLSVAVLREEFHLYHALGLGLVVIGIVTAERLGQR